MAGSTLTLRHEEFAVGSHTEIGKCVSNTSTNERPHLSAWWALQPMGGKHLHTYVRNAFADLSVCLHHSIDVKVEDPSWRDNLWTDISITPTADHVTIITQQQQPSVSQSQSRYIRSLFGAGPGTVTVAQVSPRRQCCDTCTGHTTASVLSCVTSGPLLKCISCC